MLGRGAAIIAAVLAIALRGVVALIVGPVLGAPINWFALYLGPAVVIELLALTPLIKRPIVFGAVGGLGVATVGLWLESLWIDAVYNYPWPTSIWPEALAMAVPVAVLTGACGAMVGMVLTDQRLPRARVSIGLVVLTVVAIGGATANGLRYEVPQNATATIALTEAAAGSAASGWRRPTCSINPPTSSATTPTGCRSWAGRAAWPTSVAIFTDHLERSGPATTARPSRCRCRERGRHCCACTTARTLAAVPIYPARRPGHRCRGGPRRGVDDAAVRRRDHHPAARAQPRHPAGAVAVGCLVVLVCTLVLIGGLSLGRGPDQQERADRGRKAESSRRRRHDRAARRRDPRRPRAAAGAYPRSRPRSWSPAW